MATTRAKNPPTCCGTSVMSRCPIIGTCPGGRASCKAGLTLLVPPGKIPSKSLDYRHPPMDVKDRIHQTVTGHPVVLFMKGNPQQPMCGFSMNACQILNACG